MVSSNYSYAQTGYVGDENAIDYKYIKGFDKGADINSGDTTGQTPLIKAAIDGDEKIIEFLMQIKANINARDNLGNTALHYAAYYNHADIVQKLIDNGAYQNVTNYESYTPLDMAGSNNSRESYNILYRKLAQPNLNASTSGISQNTYLWAGAGALAAVAGVAVAAGGGGGNSDEAPTFDPTLPPTIPAFNPIPAPPISYNQSEYDNQSGLALIKADAAYARGYNGAGVKVAVIDSGVQLSHPELVNQVSSSNVSFTNGNGIVSAGDGNAATGENHGTHVSGIVANDSNNFGVLGVAFGSEIIAINVEGSAGIQTSDVVAGINHAVNNGARVINLSLGGSEDQRERNAISSAMRARGANSVLIAAATGNSSAASQPLYPSRYAGESAFNIGLPGYNLDDGGVILAVGAVDTNGNIASFSTRCGDAKNWCLVAPGTSIVSSVQDGEFARFSGTSMAAPHVSGAAAILMQMDPQLSAREVGEILLLTADPLGAQEISEIYGHGLLNLDKATSPVGKTSVPLGNSVGSPSVDLNSTRFSTSGVFGDSVSGANLSFAVLDSYNRDFTMNLNDINDGENRLRNFEQNLQNFSNDITQNRQNLNDNLSFAADQVRNYNQGVDQDENLRRFSMSANYDKYSVDVNSNVAMNQSFRMKALNDVAMATDNSGNNSVLGLVTTGISNNNTYNLDKNSSLSFGSFRSEEDFGEVFGAVSEYNYAKDKYNLGLQVGMINEKDSLLGGQMTGAFALNDNTSTWFSSLGSSYNVTDDVQLFGSFNYGVTFAEASALSLIEDISNIQSTSFSLGVSKKSVLKDNDKFEFIVSQPLRVVNASATLTLPTTRDIDGNIFSSTRNINLSPTGREINFGAFYSLVNGDKSSFSAGAMYVLDPGHNDNIDDDMRFMAKYDLKF